MGKGGASGSVRRTDYEWSYTEEPHATRRKQILSKYPQIKDLYGVDPTIKWVTLSWLVAQFVVGYLLRDASWFHVFVVAYCFGSFANQALFLAMHEISHNLAFKTSTANRIFGCIANLTTAVPHFSMFQRYHMEHHQYQGVDGVDSDIPSRWEGVVFGRNMFTKTIWMALQPLFYVTRPLFVKPKKPGKWEAINWGLTFIANALIFYFFGIKFLGYFLLSSLLGSGIHPVAGHFIAEHYVFVKGHETYSYYGPLNLITFNVGYHNEHHDFPRIPGSRLPQVREIAKEYYEDLPSYNSWTKVIWDYVMDPAMGPYSRVVRKSNKVAKIKEEDYNYKDTKDD